MYQINIITNLTNKNESFSDGIGIKKFSNDLKLPTEKQVYGFLAEKIISYIDSKISKTNIAEYWNKITTHYIDKTNDFKKDNPLRNNYTVYIDIIELAKIKNKLLDFKGENLAFFETLLQYEKEILSNFLFSLETIFYKEILEKIKNEKIPLDSDIREKLSNLFDLSKLNALKKDLSEINNTKSKISEYNYKLNNTFDSFFNLSLKDTKANIIDIKKDSSYNFFKDNKFILLSGDISSGKSFLSEKIQDDFLKEFNYYPYQVSFKNNDIYDKNLIDFLFILNISINLTAKKLILILDNIDNLSIKNQKEVLFLLENLKTKSNITIFATKTNKINEEIEKIFDYQLEIQLIKYKIDNNELFITPYEKKVLEDLKEKNKDIYYENQFLFFSQYLNTLLNEFQKKVKLKDSEFIIFKKELKKVAFYSIETKINLFSLNRLDIDNLFLEILEKYQNKIKHIISIEPNNYNEISFSTSIFQKIFATEYILSSNKNLSIDKGNSGYNKIFVFVAEYILKSRDFIILEKIPSIIKGILYYLRINKDYDIRESIFQLLKSNSEIYHKNYSDINIELAKSDYYKGDYIDSLEKSRKTYEYFDINNEQKAEIFNHIASCLNDLLLPKLALQSVKKAIEYKSYLHEPRILGNKARANLKLGNYEKALEIFEEKHSLHSDPAQKIRDEIDVILAKSFIKIINFTEIKKQFDILLEKTESIDKIYLIRNITYFDLNKFDKDFIDKIILEMSKLLPKLSKAPDIQGGIATYYFNLGKFYYKNEPNKGKEHLLNSLKIFEKDYYNLESYLVSGFLYYFTNDSTYLDISNNYYQKMKEQSLEALILFGYDKDCLEEFFEIKELSFFEDKNDLLSYLNKIVYLS